MTQLDLLFAAWVVVVSYWCVRKFRKALHNPPPAPPWPPLFIFGIWTWTVAIPFAMLVGHWLGSGGER